MGDLDLSGSVIRILAVTSAFLTDQVAEQQNRIREGFAAISEYNAKKDEALFQTAEASMKQKSYLNSNWLKSKNKIFS